MIKFEVADYKLVVTVETLMVAEFRKLVESDLSPEKSQAVKDLLFVWGMYDEQSIYTSLTPEEKETAVRRDAYGSPNYVIPADRQKYIDAAVDVYAKYNETSERRLLLVMNRKVDQMTAKLDKMAVDTDEEFDRVMAIMGKLKLIVSAREEATLIIERGIQKGKTRTKGNQARSPREMGKLGYKPKN